MTKTRKSSSEAAVRRVATRKLPHNEPEDHKTRMSLRKAARALRMVTQRVSTGKYTPAKEAQKHGSEHR